MKKIVLTLIMGAMLSTMATAQTDTIPWKYNKYHYSLWYDTLPEFFNYWACYTDVPTLRLAEWVGDYPRHVTPYPQHVDHPTLVQGIAILQPMSFYYWSIIQNQRYTEEYMYHTVSSNNGGTAYCGSLYYEYVYYPVEPLTIYNNSLLSDPSWCPKPSWWILKDWDIKQTRQWRDYPHTYNSPIFGMYFPIVDYVELIMASADTVMGTVEPPSMRVSRNITQSILAVPKHGYRFSHWQEDGDTHASRIVTITQDTTRFTAVFEPMENCP
ncbi:MAG: hypothetical protein IJK84_07240 [Bacteroidales bacterium]|nr:hypothetical protein [Bacteroidales bacterium]